jgi:polar amino acid transport system ATP-binding protein
MDEGRIVESGPPDTILDHPMEPRTQQFLRLVAREDVTVTGSTAI